MNLFATVLTKKQPCANYRGESELNRAVIQKVTDGRFDYPIFSPESMRNALRETLRKYGLPSNRERLPNEDQLAVKFEDYPDPDNYADDFFFGYLVAAGNTDRKEIKKILTESRGKTAADRFTFKRDSALRMNLAKALEPYRYNAIFTQSPQDLTPKEVKKFSNDTKSNLLHRETVVSAFQYPFALNRADCQCSVNDCDHGEPEKDEEGKPNLDEQNKRRLVCKDRWTRKLIQAIGELNDVAGNHARSYFEMAPESILVRLTTSLVAGYQTYCFKPDGKIPDVLEDIIAGDYPGNEFYLGGEIVKRGLTKTLAKDLESKGVTLERDPQGLLAVVADKFLGEE
jgi:CRISPR-associated protein Cst2